MNEAPIEESRPVQGLVYLPPDRTHFRNNDLVLPENASAEFLIYLKDMCRGQIGNVYRGSKASPERSAGVLRNRLAQARMGGKEINGGLHSGPSLGINASP